MKKLGEHLEHLNKTTASCQFPVEFSSGENNVNCWTVFIFDFFFHFPLFSSNFWNMYNAIKCLDSVNRMSLEKFFLYETFCRYNALKKNFMHFIILPSRYILTWCYPDSLKTKVCACVARSFGASRVPDCRHGTPQFREHCQKC